MVNCVPRNYKALSLIPSTIGTGVVAHGCNSNPRELKAEESEVKCHPGLHSEILSCRSAWNPGDPV